MPSADLPEDRLLDRELSWLDFNERVLWLTEDRSLPLLDRVRFAGIFASNLEEFFRVRVAGIEQRLAHRTGRDTPDGRPAGLGAGELLRRIRSRVLESEYALQQTLSRELLPELEANGLPIRSFEELDEAQRSEATEVFWHELLPALTPIPLEREWAFPGIPGMALGLAVRIERTAEEPTHAFVRIPRTTTARLILVGSGERAFVPAEAVVAAHLAEVFPGARSVTAMPVRVIRDADVEYDEVAGDLVRSVESELRHRRHGPVVRLSTCGEVDDGLLHHLHEVLGTHPRQHYPCPSMLAVDGLGQVVDMPGFDHLRSEPIQPRPHPDLAAAPAGSTDSEAIFGLLREREVLVQHPYQSYAQTVERFVATAVADPDVLAIKHTVYRTSGDTAVVPALIHARNRERRAVCLVEIKARFDELANIRWGRELEHAGVEVSYGLPGLKTHMKVILVVRREEGGVRRYAHVGTGNYHAGTARLYGDLGLFTSDPDTCADLADVFHWVTDGAPEPTPRRILLAPRGLRDGIIAEVERCAEAARRGEHARILMKMNSLVDAECIDALYRASQAGVEVVLNVRGICCLRPGVPGLSETISVVSVVGRVLEHGRVYCFEAGTGRSVWIGSADLMPRNLNSRVEVLVPVDDPGHREELAWLVERFSRERTRAWELQPDGSWTKRMPPSLVDPNATDVHLELAHAAATGSIPPDAPDAVPGGKE